MVVTLASTLFPANLIGHRPLLILGEVDMGPRICLCVKVQLRMADDAGYVVSLGIGCYSEELFDFSFWVTG